MAEEKEVKQILSKVMEARRSKSYESYEILGKFVGRDQVTKLILPLKEVRAGWSTFPGALGHRSGLQSGFGGRKGGPPHCRATFTVRSAAVPTPRVTPAALGTAASGLPVCERGN